MNVSRRLSLSVISLALALASGNLASGQSNGYTKEDAVRRKTVLSARMSPDGQNIAYVLNVPRDPYDEDDGSAWTELHVVGADGEDGRLEADLHGGGDGGAGQDGGGQGGREAHGGSFRVPVY